MKVNFPEPAQGLLKAGAALFVGLFGVLNVEFLLALAKAIFVSSPQIFTGVTIGALTVPEFLPPTSTGDYVGLAAAGLFALYLGYKVYQNFDARGLT